MLARDKCAIISKCGSGIPEINRKGQIPMSTIEILTFGILLVDLIGLVYNISRKR